MMEQKSSLKAEFRAGSDDLAPPPRGQWSNKREFLLVVAGQIIGLGNVWRFPYLCYKNGGGVFFIPYLLFLFTCGIPLFLLETALGQFSQQGGVTCWRRICPLFQGVGIGSQVVVFYSSIYYIIILSWAFLYLFSCFNLYTALPWASCNNTWNTDACVEFDQDNGFQNMSIPENATSPVTEFWERRVLKITGSVYELGSVRWELASCLLLSWIICYFCTWKGVKSTGKVAYVTATFPYAMMFALLVRGVTLPGAFDGIKFYLYPDPQRLADPQVWMDAGTQIFYSYAVCLGCLSALGSFNRFHNDCYRDTLCLCFLNSATSFVAGFAVFSALGFMAYEQNTHISKVAESGPGLAFIVFPRAVAMMPFPHLWATCFFIMILLLGLDTQFVGVEALTTGISDLNPGFFHVGHRRKLLLLVLSSLCFLLGLVMVTEGGLYVFQVFDFYACSGKTLLLFALLQSVCVGWVYGADRFFENIKVMIGYRPSVLIQYSLKYATPLVCTGTLIFSLVKHTPLRFNSRGEDPLWGMALGWWFTLSSTLMIPLWMLYKLSTTPGTLQERISASCSPAEDLPEKSPETMALNSAHQHLESETKPGADSFLRHDLDPIKS